MWTSTLELKPARVIPTKILGSFWRGAYFSSFAPLQVQNLPRQPLPASNWVRVRNSLAGICGSDLHSIFVDGDFNVAPAALPNRSRTYPGHEVVGEVIEVGDDVQALRVGDRVVLQHGPNCLTAGIQPPCRSCVSGNFGLCESGVLPGLQRRQPIGGGWSEEMLLHEQQLFRIPSGINDAQAVLLEPVAVALHAALRYLPRAEERVLIIGAGTMGQLILQVIRALAPGTEVDVLARHAFQVERAASMGARIIYPQDSYEGVQHATGAKLYQGVFGNRMLLGGYDVIYDTVGSKRTVHDALRWARAGSAVVMVGRSLHRMHIDLTPIWYQEVNLLGILGHGTESWPIGTSEKKTTIEIAAELIASGQLQPDKLITHTFLLSEYRTALMTARDKAHNRAMKVVFDFSKQPPSVVPNVRAASRQHWRTLPAGETPNTGEQTPSRLYTDDSEDAGEDVQTVVVSPSKHPHFDTAFPAGSSGWNLDSVPQRNVEDSEDITTRITTEQALYDVTSQYGSLPGFHQGLEELDIAPKLSDQDDDTRKVTVTYPPEHPQTPPPINTDEDNVEAPFMASIDMDFTWTQFISPQDIGESNVEDSSAAPTDIVQSDVEIPFTMLHKESDVKDDPKTVTVSPPKRTRSKRDSSKAVPGEVSRRSIETENASNVTKDSPDAFLE